jgi:hypothetical protein
MVHCLLTVLAVSPDNDNGINFSPLPDVRALLPDDGDGACHLPASKVLPDNLTCPVPPPTTFIVLIFMLLTTSTLYLLSPASPLSNLASRRHSSWPFSPKGLPPAAVPLATHRLPQPPNHCLLSAATSPLNRHSRLSHLPLPLVSH